MTQRNRTWQRSCLNASTIFAAIGHSVDRLLGMVDPPNRLSMYTISP
jgi:hypothetical protein